MILRPVSKKLRKYAFARQANVNNRAELLALADEVKELEARLFESEKELAWRDLFEKQEYVKGLQKKLGEALELNRAWKSTFHCDAPWEAEAKHKADIAILETKWDEDLGDILMMLPLQERNKYGFWHTSCDTGKTKFFRRKS